MKQICKYYQLLDMQYNQLEEGNDNPARIPDNTRKNTALRMAKNYMILKGVKEAQLIRNIATPEADNIEWIEDITR